MTSVTVRGDVAASAFEVWRYRLDFYNLPEYNDDVTNLSLEHEGSLVEGVPGQGSVYRFTLASKDAVHVVFMEVTEVEVGLRVRASMKGTVDAHEIFEVTPHTQRRCAVALTLWLDLPKEMESHKEAMAEHGRIQLQKELDAIEVHFASRSVST